MMSKQLTQAVFEGLLPEYRWAAIDANGDAFAFDRHPPFIRDGMWLAEVGYRRLGDRYDATGWQNSLIERTVSEENQALAEAQAEIECLKSELKAKDEALQFMVNARQQWHEMYMQKQDAIERFKAGLIRAGAKVPIDAEKMNAHEQGLSIALVLLESELKYAAKRKYDIASILNPEEQDNELLAAIDQQTTEIEALKAELQSTCEILKEVRAKHGQRLATLLDRKWISVADELPPLRTDVLFFSPHCGFFVDQRLESKLIATTHWQPLPAPPENEK